MATNTSPWTRPNFWDDIAESYAAKPVERPEAFERKIEITRALMKPGCTVLDIGCGTGSLALRLAPSAAAVHGLDLSPEMVRIARGKARAQGVDNVTFHVGAFDDSFAPFGPESLDGICAYSLLHLVESPAEALSAIHRRLQPGGFFVSSTACLGNMWMPMRPIIAVMRAFGKAPMVKIMRRRDLIRLIEAAGFVDIEQPDVGAASSTAFVVARKPA